MVAAFKSIELLAGRRVPGRHRLVAIAGGQESAKRLYCSSSLQCNINARTVPGASPGCFWRAIAYDRCQTAGSSGTESREGS
jgi:hypothetical protein